MSKHRHTSRPARAEKSATDNRASLQLAAKPPRRSREDLLAAIRSVYVRSPQTCPQLSEIVRSMGLIGRNGEALCGLSEQEIIEAAEREKWKALRLERVQFENDVIPEEFQAYALRCKISMWDMLSELLSRIAQARRQYMETGHVISDDGLTELECPELRDLLNLAMARENMTADVLREIEKNPLLKRTVEPPIPSAALAKYARLERLSPDELQARIEMLRAECAALRSSTPENGDNEHGRLETEQ